MNMCKKLIFIFVLSLFWSNCAQADFASVPDENFPAINGVVRATTLSEDGSVLYVGGDFTYVSPDNGGGAVFDLNSGDYISGFPIVNGLIRKTISDGSGGWYIGGDFSVVGTYSRYGLVHIKADKSVDADWDPMLNGTVYEMLLNGSILYVGGSFSSAGGQDRNNIVAINASTGLATDWNPGSSIPVLSLAINDSTLFIGTDYIYIWGNFWAILNAVSVIDGTELWRISQTTGAIKDLSYSNGNLYIVGGFTSLNGASRNHIAAVNATSSIVSSWNPSPNSPTSPHNNGIKSIFVNGSTVYVGGDFTSIGGQARNYVAALDVSTGLATNWNPNANEAIIDFNVGSSTIFVSGLFTSIGGYERNGLASFDTATGLFTDWNPDIQPVANCLAISGNNLYVGGDVGFAGGETRNHLAAISTLTGQLTDWNPNANGNVYAIALDGTEIYIGGDFTNIGGETRNRIALVDNELGSIADWNPGAGSVVRTIALDDTNVYVGGSFTDFGGQVRNRIAAADRATGSVTDWNPNSSGSVNTMIIDGNLIYVGGSFTNIGYSSRNYAAAIYISSGYANLWNPNANQSIYSVLVDSSRTYLGGYFSRLGGAVWQGGYTRYYIGAVTSSTGSSIAWTPYASSAVISMAIDGSDIFLGGEFGVTQIRIATGLETGWNSVPSGLINSMTVSSSTLYIAGSFATASGNKYLASFSRLPSVSSITPSDDATYVESNSDLVINFNENVSAVVDKYILIKKYSDDSTVVVVAADSNLVTTNDNVVTINPLENLEEETEYYIEIEEGSFVNGAGRGCAGISNKDEWTFTTKEYISPTITNFFPTDDASNVSSYSDLTISFSEPVEIKSGNITIFNASDDSVFDTINASSSVVIGSGTDTITIYHDSHFDLSNSYYIKIDSTVFDDFSGNSFVGIDDDTTWNFTAFTTTHDIYTCADLQAMQNNLGDIYILRQDIDCAGYSYTPVDNFIGELDGNGYAINNLVTNNNIDGGTGIFGSIYFPADIHDLTIANSNIGDTSSGLYSSYSGTVAGIMYGGFIDNVTIDSSVVVNGAYYWSGTGSGGLVGLVSYDDNDVRNSIISNCISYASFDTNNLTNNNLSINYIGGLVGSVITRNNDFSLDNSVAYLNFTGLEFPSGVGACIGSLRSFSSLITISNITASSTLSHVGGSGLIGRISSQGDSVINIASSTISSIFDTTYNAGGVVGALELSSGDEVSLANLVASSSIINSGDNLGGIIGILDIDDAQLTIENVHSTGGILNVNSEYVGGLLGFVGAEYGDEEINIIESDSSMSIINNLADSHTGGLVGSIEFVSNFNIQQSYYTGDILGLSNLGGLVGYIDTSTVNLTESFSSGAINGNDYIGGIVGQINYQAGFGNVAVENCYSSGVLGNGVDSSYVGGIIGAAQNNGTSLSKVYSSSNIALDLYSFSGGLVGNGTALLSDCFYSPEIIISNNYATSSSALIGNFDINDYYVEEIEYFRNNYYVNVPNTDQDYMTYIAEGANYFKNSSSNPPFDAWSFSGANQIWVTRSSAYPGLYFLESNVSAPISPSGLTATSATNNSINLSWVDNSDNETSFIIEKSLDNVNFSNASTVFGDITTLLLTGLMSNTPYWFRVVAENSAGISEYSNVVAGTTLNYSGGNSGGGGGGGTKNIIATSSSIATTSITKASSSGLNIDSPSQFSFQFAGNALKIFWKNSLNSFLRKTLLFYSLSPLKELSPENLKSKASLLYEGTNEEYESKTYDLPPVNYYYLLSQYQDGRFSPVLTKMLLVFEDDNIIKYDLEALSVFSKNELVELDKDSIQLYDNLVRDNGGKIEDYDMKNRYSLAYFINNGTESTDKLGKGERAGVINSYVAAYDKFPENETEWEDLIKIANGRWPLNRDVILEEKAKSVFRKIYKRDVNSKYSYDNNAVIIIAYGLRPKNRNIISEIKAIMSYKNIFGGYPDDTLAWNVVRAIAYSGARR